MLDHLSALEYESLFVVFEWVNTYYRVYPELVTDLLHEGGVILDIW